MKIEHWITLLGSFLIAFGAVWAAFDLLGVKGGIMIGGIAFVILAMIIKTARESL